jgi:hypothetical protein
MKRSSCLVLMVIVFSGIRPAEPGEVVFPHESSSFHDLSNRDIFRLGMAGAADAALENVHLRAAQAKGLIGRAHAKIRSMIGLSPKPTSLVAGEFLKNDLPPKEMQALDHLNREHTFTPHTVENNDVATTKVLEPLIGRLKVKLDTVLADKTNYSDSKHIDVLVKEVKGLLDALEKAIEQKITNFQAQNLDVTNLEPEDNENLSYLSKIKESLKSLIDIQEIQKKIVALHRTPFQNMVGKRLFGTSSQEFTIKRQSFVSMSKYLFIDSRIATSRGQNLSLPAGLLFLEGMIRKQAFDFCQPVLLKDYASQSPEKKGEVLQFFTDYNSYQEGGVGKLRIKTDWDKIMQAPSPMLTEDDHTAVAQQVRDMEHRARTLYPVEPTRTVAEPAPVMPDRSALELQQAQLLKKKTRLIEIQQNYSMADALRTGKEYKEDLKKLKKNTEAIKAAKTLPVAPRVPNTEEATYIAQKQKALESVGVKIDKYQKDFENQVEKIDGLLAEDSLQEVDFDQLLSLYNELQKFIDPSHGQYKILSDELGAVLLDAELINQSLGELRSKERELYIKLNRLQSDYSQKQAELKSLGIDQLGGVIETFTGAENAIRQAEIKKTFGRQLKDRVLGAGQKLSDGLVKQLCELVFFKLQSQRLQNGVREVALEYLGRGLPADQFKQLNDFYKKLVMYRTLVSEGVDSTSSSPMQELVDELEALKGKVKVSPVPESFRGIILSKIQDEINTLTKKLSPVDGAVAQIRSQLLNVIAGKEALEEFQKKNLDKTDSESWTNLLAQYDSTDEVLKWESFINPKMPKDAVYEAIVKLENASKALRLDDSSEGKVLKGVGGILTSNPEKIGQLHIDVPTVLGPLFRLLFFNKEGAEWAQDSIQNRSLALLEQVERTQGLLTDEERSVFKKAIGDYKTFKGWHDQIQALKGLTEITVAQKAALEELKASITSFLNNLPTAYPGIAYVNTLSEGHHVVPVPSYVETGFRNQIRIALQPDLKQVGDLDALKVIPEVVPSDDHISVDHSDDNSDTASFLTAQGSERKDTDSNATTLVTAEGETLATERMDDFEKALPQKIQDEVDRAIGYIAQLKIFAAQFAVHEKSVDSIGLAEEGFAIILAFEATMPHIILDHNEGVLQRQVDALKLLFNNAMNKQKLKVVVSLQALRAPVTREFGTTVFPLLTSDFRQQVEQILSPQFESSLSEGSAFRNFVIQERQNLNSATGTKVFFTLLDQVQEALEAKGTQYTQEAEKLSDQNVLDVFTAKQGVGAALTVVVPRLEDAYKLAVFETLTPQQQAAFKKINLVLYEELVLKKQAQALMVQFENYLLDAYKVDFDAVETVQQAQVLLQGDKHFGGVEKQLAIYESFMSTLRVSKSVDLAFELYEKLTPLYEELKKVEKTFTLLKRDKITDLITFTERFNFYKKSVTYSPPLVHENYEIKKFFINPVGVLQNQEKDAQTHIAAAISSPNANPDELLERAKTLKEKIDQLVNSTAQEMREFTQEADALMKDYQLLKKAYKKYQDVDAVVTQMLVPEKPLTFETNLQSPEGRKKTVEFIARALSGPGCVYVPPFMVLDDSKALVPGQLPTDRATLLARLRATGKTSGEGTTEKPYRDLEHVLDNDFSWALEIRKLEGDPFILNKEQTPSLMVFFELLQKEKMKNSVLEGNMSALNPLVIKIQQALQITKAVK